MRLFSAASALLLSSTVAGWPHPANSNHHRRSDYWDLKKFKSLVAFGDSYTDEDRLTYFAEHNGSAPPVGWVEPESYSTSSGGRIWARYVADYAGVNLYDYAVSGATCSNKLVSRYYDAINAPFPDVDGYELPAFLDDKAYTVNGTAFLDIPPEQTVYSLWIGTNDLGNYAYLTDSQTPGKTLVDYLDCVYTQFDRMYKSGGRYFVLMNLAPLQLTPQYSVPADGNYASQQTGYNATERSYRMWEQVVLCNDVYDKQTPFDLLIKQRYPEAHFAIMNTYGLLSDIYHNPENYLNGTSPLNVTGYSSSCKTASGATCEDPDSFMWYDALHPSEQTDRVIARNFVDVVRGDSQWATYW
ncbi:carbohydrate esterase family 16 protein [Saccharata proteae CBS 121410]|uniref:Carbohydrate esterase family 16 protein n=1 Tax=Saccharata proteae CBS 121410 TaxID=1314787 RepID=A0A9P4I554_9PEZI|nr:carbohydrate esterase family 16 protein [Saccharata proteae CBS 121410]